MTISKPLFKFKLMINYSLTVSVLLTMYATFFILIFRIFSYKNRDLGLVKKEIRQKMAEVQPRVGTAEMNRSQSVS